MLVKKLRRLRVLAFRERSRVAIDVSSATLSSVSAKTEHRRREIIDGVSTEIKSRVAPHGHGQAAPLNTRPPRGWNVGEHDPLQMAQGTLITMPLINISGQEVER